MHHFFWTDHPQDFLSFCFSRHFLDVILHQTKSVGDQLFFWFGGQREVKGFDVGGEGAAVGSAG
jgi:hypothetical protein